MKCHQRLQIDRDSSMGFLSDSPYSSHQQNRAPTRVPLFGRMTSHFWSRQISQRTVRLPESDRWSDKPFPGSHKYEEFSQVEGVLGAAYCASWNIKDVQLGSENRRTGNDTDMSLRNSSRDEDSNSFDREDVRSTDFWNSPRYRLDEKKLDERNENGDLTKKSRRRRLFVDDVENETNGTFSGHKLNSDLVEDIETIGDGKSAREKSYKDVGVNTESDNWEDKRKYCFGDDKGKIFNKPNLSERNGLGTKTDRHCRPLTPPRDSNYSDYANDLYENQYFAREHSKLRAMDDGSEEETDRSTLNDRWSTDRKQELECHNYPGSDRKQKMAVEIRNDDRDVRRSSQRYLSSDSEDEDEDEDYFRGSQTKKLYRIGKSSVMPERKSWNYRDGGVQITDIENGQPCSECGELCSGFSPHDWRKNCTSCKCPREAHEVCHEEWVSVRARLGLKGGEPNPSIVFDPRDKGFAWTPPGLPAHRVEEYFSMLPEISVARLGTPGERYRDRQLATQLPKQDLARAYCRHLEPEHSTSADDFMAARNEIALDIGSVQEVSENGLICRTCKEPLKYGSLAVSASKLGLLYHPMCFQCVQCRELLVDLAYCVHDDALYCERHYAEQLKPRCAACDELIFSGEYTKAMNKDWHSGHFCCWQCDESLTGQRYVLRDEHPYCIKCYESVFANGCEECNKIIGIDSKDLSYKDKHWHEACFLCNKCRVSLVDKQFGSKVDKIYCGNCYDAQFASRCDGCGEIFRAGTKKMEYKTRQWHEKCFCCCVCKNPIGTKSFIPREQEIYCAGCYEDKFATRCIKCNKIITSGGVTYKNEPWHRDCFTCTNCDMSLAGQRFTSRDDKPYCADCFGELFAKRCTACSKPITGIGGTRFISFEDRHWHNDCFICAGCSTSLVGRGFITDGDDIICPDCAKSKLS